MDTNLLYCCSLDITSSPSQFRLSCLNCPLVCYFELYPVHLWKTCHLRQPSLISPDNREVVSELLAVSRRRRQNDLRLQLLLRSGRARVSVVPMKIIYVLVFVYPIVPGQSPNRRSLHIPILSSHYPMTAFILPLIPVPAPKPRALWSSKIPFLGVVVWEIQPHWRSCW